MPAYPGPISSNILDDFQAPPEATKPYQDHLTRIRQSFGSLDGHWLKLKFMMRDNVVFDEAEQAVIDSFDRVLREHNAAIHNRPLELPPEQEPAKGAQTTH